MIVKHVQTQCTHCGLPVPSGLLDATREEQFCCGGCAAAWQLIHSSGLDSFYRMVEDDHDRSSLQDRVGTYNSDHAFAEFNEAGFLEKFARQGDQGPTVKLSLDGIHCAACVWLIEKLPTILPGVASAQVNWARQTVAICWNPDLVNLSDVAAALYRLGYTPHPFKENQSTNRRNIENRKQLIRIGIAAAAAGNNMMIAAALYLGMFSYMSAGMETLLRVASCVVGLASFLGPGRIFLQGAVNALKTRTAHMDLPIAVALTVGSVAGLVNTIRGEGEIYFDSLSVLICLLLIGRWIQFRQQNRAADAVDLLYRLTPQRARRIEKDGVGEDSVVEVLIVEVSVDDLKVGDLIQIRPGDLLPADGVVVTGHSLVDESILTGESCAVQKSVGQRVSAGTLNSNSVLEVNVTATGDKTRISNILELVEKATTDKPRIVQWADQIGGYFVCVVLLLAAITFTAWMMIEPERAVDRAVALLIVACPCALAMATPLAISVALGRLAKRKILVKSGDVLQSLNRPGTIWLDKTGTLTHGKMTVNDWQGDKSWLAVISEIESKFNHPIASAFVDFASETIETQMTSANVVAPLIEKVESQNGGVVATVNGVPLLIGNRELLQTNGVMINGNGDDGIEGEKRPGENYRWEATELNAIANCCSPCWIASGGTVVGMASIGDSIRSEAKSVISQLQQRGWTVGVLSGDHEEIVKQVAGQLGIQAIHAGVTPEEKLAIIQQSTRTHETTVMVGDGVNDSAALAAATVGIAVQGGAEASLAAAPVYLGSSDLSSIIELLNASRSTTRTISVNFGASLTYNLLGIGLAMAGWLNPLVAAVLMPVSSLTVLSLSANAARKKGNFLV